MTESRIARAEAGTLEDRIFQRALEARRPKARVRTVVLHDNQPAPLHKGPGRFIVLRILSTKGPKSQHGPANERVRRAKAPTQPASPTTDPGKNDCPATAKPEAEMTIPELEQKLAELEAEILAEERRTP